MKPFVVGRNVEDIEDIWQSAYVQSYFRSGVTLNNALSGIDGGILMETIELAYDDVEMV